MSRYTAPITLTFIFIIFLTWICYSPGLNGPFLFDDFPNLEKLGALGPINSWEIFQAYLKKGFAGPTGRPVSLTSFLINANDWPADPYSFKRTNLLIHIMTGILLFGMMRKLLKLIGRKQSETEWIALLAASLWMLNPFFVSTTLYIVQRMTQLSALFTILGIWGYLQGRSWLTKHPSRGYLMITGSIGICTLLATCSKENGALLPALILIMELTLSDHWKNKGPDQRWIVAFLWIPTLIIIIYLAIPLAHLFRLIPARHFSLFERLLTEARIFWDYLFHLLVPHIQTRGLYQDGILKSSSLLSPWTTLPSVFGLCILVISAWIARNRYPLISLAILFFFAGQSIESTTIPLELYFEHRNYLPSIFLFLMVASIIFEFRKYTSLSIPIFLSIIICFSYGFATWQRAKIWGNEPLLSLTWAEMNPNSPRAQIEAARTFLILGENERGFKILHDAARHIPNHATILSAELAFKAEMGILTPKEFSTSARKLRELPFDSQVLRSLKNIVESINAHGYQPEQTRIMMDLLTGIRSDLDGKISVATKYTYYLQGLLAAGQGNTEEASEYFNQAFKIYNSVETGLNIVTVLATFHEYEEAQNFLDKTNELLRKTTDQKLTRSRDTYQKEILRLKKQLESDLSQQSENHHLKKHLPSESLSNP